MLDVFLEKIQKPGFELYPAQEEAILEIFLGHNVILSTPTGSGKSTVALAAHYKALQEGKRSFYTCPIKALVSEKFFALCDFFGPECVGMMTGDASVNSEAPIICCTAEILANLALRLGSDCGVDFVVMDEFHYYSDPERGMAWQIPLLTLSKTKFLLMSATLGDSETIQQELEELNGVPTIVVKSSDRPVPLDYAYRETPIHETLSDLIHSKKYPIYVVNFTQRECAIEAQNAMSVNISSREEKKQIEAYFEGFRFDTPFGKEMRRYLSHGIGLHHAGILPKYRLLVEKLAQTGLLKIIMGTDTLGVGVNIPIRSVLFTKLCKFDGFKTGILSVRDFKQIAGRAGRKGFDEQGSVLCQAPEHVIENKRQEMRFSADAKQKKKIVRKSAPTANYVHWDSKTFERLIEQPPEALISRFQVTHGLIMTLLQGHPSNANPGYRELVRMIAQCHETSKSKSKLRKQSAILLKSLVHAKLVSFVNNRLTGRRLVVNETLQHDFSLHHTLSLYLLDTLKQMDADSPEYALDVLSLTEAILENPRIILTKQVDKLKSAKLAEMRQQGLEYEERMAELEKMEHPKPLRDFIYNTYNAFEDQHPWLKGDNIQPKSVAREMIENLSAFNEYVKEYGLERSEGVFLRYLSMVYKAYTQTIPEPYQNDSFNEVASLLKAVVLKTDSSLLNEWENLLRPQTPSSEIELRPQWVFNEKQFRAEVRAIVLQLVGALGRKDFEEAASIIPYDYEKALHAYFEQHERILSNHQARFPIYTRFEKVSDYRYRVKQVILDPQSEHDWYLDFLAEQCPGASLPTVSLEEINR
ncbi:MAG: DUF3516 domain-containing protein [Myxococcaceae bacterium]|nr:DUF3516 domain-containing protein [Myxococcaceae bacterium]MBH2006363.1 DUF3516 domain-containing protein [Myxococcaceae bacterium]